MNFFGVDEGSLFTFGNMGDTLGDLRMGVSIICEILSQLIFVMLTWKKTKVYHLIISSHQHIL